MKLAISNIAWDIAEDETVAPILQRFGVTALEIAPRKYFADPGEATDAEIAQVKHVWQNRGIEIVAMQALLFGSKDLNIFGLPVTQEAMLGYLKAICRIGAGLGAKSLVFGSPKNRDRIGLTDKEAIDYALSFLKRLADIAKSHGVMICLEPTPAHYGGNFMVNCAQTAYIVEQLAHSAIKMQFDTGAITLNEESPSEVLQAYAHLIGHVHASEPDLVPIGDRGTDHRAFAKALQAHIPKHWVSVEMLATSNESHETSITRALAEAIRCYANA